MKISNSSNFRSLPLILTVLILTLGAFWTGRRSAGPAVAPDAGEGKAAPETGDSGAKASDEKASDGTGGDAEGGAEKPIQFEAESLKLAGIRVGTVDYGPVRSRLEVTG